MNYTEKKNDRWLNSINLIILIIILACFFIAILIFENHINVSQGPELKAVFECEVEEIYEEYFYSINFVNKIQDNFGIAECTFRTTSFVLDDNIGEIEFSENFDLSFGSIKAFDWEEELRINGTTIIPGEFLFELSCINLNDFETKKIFKVNCFD